MPHYEKLLELKSTYPTLLDENHLPLYILMLAPYVNPALHPYTEMKLQHWKTPNGVKILPKHIVF